MHTCKTMKHFFAFIFGFLASGMALAHQGHGAVSDSHWHATDSWGLLVGAAVVVALWWGRKP